MRVFKGRSADKLKSLRLSKEEAFSGLSDTFDYALPQNWLNDFADFCIESDSVVSYDLIRSTTVWEYPVMRPIRFLGSYSQSGPVTCCEEVYSAHEEWVRFEEAV
jgi:hypothetical protein|tara:strand:+ start:1017 stop:1331 length:315 start_codon:yes stop_codon:yes gene_type:complete